MLGMMGVRRGQKIKFGTQPSQSEAITHMVPKISPNKLFHFLHNLKREEIISFKLFIFFLENAILTRAYFLPLKDFLPLMIKKNSENLLTKLNFF